MLKISVFTFDLSANNSILFGMRFFVVLFLSLVLPLSAGNSFAQEQQAPNLENENPQTLPDAVPDAAPQAAPEVAVETEDEDQSGDRSDSSLDSLFADLKKQTRTGAANLISKRIWAQWNDSGSKSVDLLMSRAATAMNDERNALALDVLAQVITLRPEYAEGWNRRATLYFKMKEFGRSISDIERTLALEPRHFGALSGLGIILQRLGRDQTALDTWYKVLALYPANKQAQKQVIELVEKLSGQKT